MSWDISDYRIDYIRMKLPFEIERMLQAQDYYALLVENICHAHDLPNECYAFGKFRDTSLKKDIPFFECWGLVSEAVFQKLNAYELSQCTRLDIRKYLDDTNVNFSLMHIFALNYNRANGTTRRIDSPYRNKKNGRDVGGTSIILGGEDSDKRLATYRRGKELPAHEAQLKGRPLKELVRSALAGEIEQFNDPRDNVKAALIIFLQEFTVEKYGITIADIEAGLFPQQLVVEGPLVDETLQQIDWLFGTLPQLAQEAFIETVSTITNEEAYILPSPSNGIQEDVHNALPIETER